MSIKNRAYLAALAGLAIIVALVVWIGWERVFGALEKAGWQGFFALYVISIATLFFTGAAWRVLAPKGEPHMRYLNFVFARAVRDGGSDVLPFSQVAGAVAGARAVIVRGVSESYAYASTVVDMTAEMISMIVFTSMGVVILLIHNSGLQLDNPLVAAPLAAIGLGVLGAAGFIVFQIRGGPLIEKLIVHFLPGAQQHAEALNQDIRRLYGSWLKLILSSFLHLVGWFVSAFQIWAVLQFMGQSQVDFLACAAIEALVYAARSAAFMLPNGAGVLEGAYALIGAQFGLPKETGLALAFLKRGRDLALGGPALLVWQALEGKRLFRREG